MKEYTSNNSFIRMRELNDEKVKRNNSFILSFLNSFIRKGVCSLFVRSLFALRSLKEAKKERLY